MTDFSTLNLLTSNNRYTQHVSSLSEQIAAHPFFTADVSALPFDERITLAYQRAILIMRTYSESPFQFEPKQLDRHLNTYLVDLTADDVPKMTHKFWEMHLDPNITLDYGLFTIFTAQINLTVGAFPLPHQSSRPCTTC